MHQAQPLCDKPSRVARVLGDAGLDALVAAGPENAIYLSGAYNPVRRLLLVLGDPARALRRIRAVYKGGARQPTSPGDPTG